MVVKSYPVDDELSTKVSEELWILLLLSEPNHINGTVHCVFQLLLNAELTNIYNYRNCLYPTE